MAHQSEWEDLLGKFEVTGGDDVELVKFYTAAYHAFLAPTTFNDVNGQYLGFDSQVHVMPAGRSWYSDMSIWDVHRTQFPLLALVLPEVMSDIVNSLVLMFQQGGDLPRWPMANGTAQLTQRENAH
jgi:putative alpha-1,2-mannosidase